METDFATLGLLLRQVQEGGAVDTVAAWSLVRSISYFRAYRGAWSLIRRLRRFRVPKVDETPGSRKNFLMHLAVFKQMLDEYIGLHNWNDYRGLKYRDVMTGGPILAELGEIESAVAHHSRKLTKIITEHPEVKADPSLLEEAGLKTEFFSPVKLAASA